MRTFEVRDAGEGTAGLVIYRGPEKRFPATLAGRLWGRYLFGPTLGFMPRDLPDFAATSDSYYAWEHHRAAMAYAAVIGRGDGALEGTGDSAALAFDSGHAAFQYSLIWAIGDGGLPVGDPDGRNSFDPCYALLVDNVSFRHGGLGLSLDAGWSDRDFAASVWRGLRSLRGKFPLSLDPSDPDKHKPRLILHLTDWWSYPAPETAFRAAEESSRLIARSFKKSRIVWGVMFTHPERFERGSVELAAMQTFCAGWTGEVLWRKMAAPADPGDAVSLSQMFITGFLNLDQLWVWNAE